MPAPSTAASEGSRTARGAARPRGHAGGQVTAQAAAPDGVAPSAGAEATPAPSTAAGEGSRAVRGAARPPGHAGGQVNAALTAIVAVKAEFTSGAHARVAAPLASDD